MADPVEGAGEVLSPAENEYFDSGGQKELPAEKQPAPAEADKGEPVGDGEEGAREKVEKVVPLAALHEERRRRQENDRQLQEERVKLARYEERFRIVEQLQQKAPTPPPNSQEQPFEFIDHVGSRVETIEQRLQQREAAEQQQAQQRQFLRAYASDVNHFKTETPDYDDAFAFLRKGRSDELQAMGFLDPATREQALMQDEMSIISQAAKVGIRPAQAIYAVAKARGWQGKSNGQDATEKLDNIAQGQAANKSLSGVGGSPEGGRMTAKDLAAMPIDDFRVWCEKNPKTAARLMGSA